MRLTVLGAGAWGTALAIAYARHPEHQVTLWARDAQHIAQLAQQGENSRYLAGAPLPPSLALSADFSAAVSDADLLLVVTPMAGLRPTLQQLLEQQQCKPLLWACKGIEADTGLLPHQVVAECYPPDVPVGVLSGPSFAKEVAADLPAALVLASHDVDFADRTAQVLHNPRLRLYASSDVIGVEIGAAVKNVMAIAAGMADGLQFGMNSRAALITRGLAEMARLASRLGGEAHTLSGLAGMGDLILTCTGDLSRNRRVGQALASGKTLPEILAELGHVAEGVATAYETQRLAQALQVDMPITETVCAILSGTVSIHTAVSQLLERGPRHEF